MVAQREHNPSNQFLLEHLCPPENLINISLNPGCDMQGVELEKRSSEVDYFWETQRSPTQARVPEASRATFWSEIIIWKLSGRKICPTYPICARKENFVGEGFWNWIEVNVSLCNWYIFRKGPIFETVFQNNLSFQSFEA